MIWRPMRVFATIMMIVGAFAMLAAVLALFGPSLRAGGIAVVAGVTSIPGALVGGAVFLVTGAWLRRRAARSDASRSGAEEHA